MTWTDAGIVGQDGDSRHAGKESGGVSFHLSGSLSMIGF